MSDPKLATRVSARKTGASFTFLKDRERENLGNS